jgi:hypothetical protein
MILLIAAALFVVGVVLEAISRNAPLAWGDRIAWILWAVAAILWFVTLVAGGHAA